MLPPGMSVVAESLAVVAVRRTCIIVIVGLVVVVYDAVVYDAVVVA